MGKLLKDNDGYYYQTDRRNYRIYSLVNDEKIVIFAEHEDGFGASEEKFVNWMYSEGIEESLDHIEACISDYERKEDRS